MARPSGRGEQTRRAILQAAIERFAATGFQSTAVSDIARDVEVSPAAVYAYFPSKKALFANAVDEDASGLIAEAFNGIGQGDFDFDWGSTLGRLLGALGSHPLATRVLSGEEGRTVERLFDLPAVAEVRTRFAGELSQGQARGAVRTDIDPDTMAAGVEALIMSVLIAVVQVGGSPDPVRSGGLLALLDAAIRKS